MPSGTKGPGGHIAQTGLHASAAKWSALASRGATNFPPWRMRQDGMCSKSRRPPPRPDKDLLPRKRQATRLGMRADELLERHRKLMGVPYVTALPRPANIVSKHVPDGHAAVRLVDQKLAQRRGGNVGNVLVLRQREHLVLRQPTQREAIFERNHGASSRSINA